MSVAALLVCLLASLLLSGLAPILVRGMQPVAATVLLTAAALSTAVGTGFIALVLAFDAAARISAVARYGGWRVSRLGVDSLPWIGVGCGVIGLVLLVRAGYALVRQSRELWRSAMMCRRTPHAMGLVITPDARTPYAMAGFPGRVFVGAPVLAALDPEHRRALLAHEEAHLAAWHHVYLQLVEIAIAANPLLTPVRAAVRLGTERWADERAARRLGDRRQVAAAIAAAAQFGAPPVSAIRLAGAAGPVVYRVRALLEPPRTGRAPVLALALLLLLPACAAMTTAHLTEATFERAQAHTAAVGSAGAPGVSR